MNWNQNNYIILNKKLIFEKCSHRVLNPARDTYKTALSLPILRNGYYNPRPTQPIHAQYHIIRSAVSMEIMLSDFMIFTLTRYVPRQPVHGGLCRQHLLFPTPVKEALKIYLF